MILGRHWFLSAITVATGQTEQRPIACMQTLCALVSHDDAKQRWLQSTGILALLQRLTLQEPSVPESTVPSAADPILASLGQAAPLRIWRQSARIIAMISADASSQGMIRYVGNLPA